MEFYHETFNTYDKDGGGDLYNLISHWLVVNEEERFALVSYSVLMSNVFLRMPAV